MSERRVPKGKRSKRTWDPGVDPLVFEIDEVRVGSLTAFSSQAEIQRIPMLCEIAATAYGTSGRNRPSLFKNLQALFNAAVQKMFLASERAASMKLFGLNSDRVLSLEVRQQQAAHAYDASRKLSGLTFRTNSKYEKAITVNLTRAIRELVLELADSRVLPRGEEKFYVHRQGIENEIRSAVNSGNRIVVLHGDAGTGKTDLAKELARIIATSESRVAYLDAANREQMRDKISMHLRAAGQESPSSTSDAIARFCELIRQGQELQVVVVDNAEELAELADLVPDRPRAMVVIASRIQLRQVSSAAHVRVSNMLLDEAMEMAINLLDDENPSDIRNLVEDLDCRPLAIAHSCGFLRTEEDFSIANFREALKVNIAEALALTTSEQPTLTAIYRIIAKSLEDHVLDVLDSIVHGGLVSIRALYRLLDQDSNSAADVLGAENIDPIDPLVRLKVHSGVRELERRNLINVFVWSSTSTTIDEGRARQNSRLNIPLGMHSLTRQILAIIRPASMVAIVAYIASIENSSSFGRWQSGQVIPERLMATALPLRRMLRQVGPKVAVAYPRCVALLLHVEMQLALIMPGTATFALSVLKRLIGRPTTSAASANLSLVQFSIMQYVQYDGQLVGQLSDNERKLLEEIRLDAPLLWNMAGLLAESEWDPTAIEESTDGLATELSDLATRHKEDPTRAVQDLIALGKLHQHFGRWALAECAYEDAIALCEANIDDEFLIGEALRCFAYLMIVSIGQDRPNGHLKLHARHRQLRERYKIEQALDATQHFTTLLALCDGNRATIYRDLLLGKTCERAELEKLANTYNGVVDEFAKGSLSAREAGANYGRLCTTVLFDREFALREMSDACKRALSSGLTFASLRYELALHKIRGDSFLRDGLKSRVLEEVPALIEISRRFKSPLWRADALQTASIFALCGGGERVRVEELQQEARHASLDIRRPERFSYLISRATSSDFTLLWLLGE